MSPTAKRQLLIKRRVIYCSDLNGSVIRIGIACNEKEYLGLGARGVCLVSTPSLNAWLYCCSEVTIPNATNDIPCSHSPHPCFPFHIPTQKLKFVYQICAHLPNGAHHEGEEALDIWSLLCARYGGTYSRVRKWGSPDIRKSNRPFNITSCSVKRPFCRWRKFRTLVKRVSLRESPAFLWTKYL